MIARVPRASLGERTVIGVAQLARKLGLGKLIFSARLRRWAKRYFLPPVVDHTVATIASGPSSGLKIQISPRSPRSFALGFYEIEVQQTFQQLVTPGMVVFDCGANVGFFSVLLARLVGPDGRVFAFEPSSAAVAALEVARTENQFHQLMVEPKAVWDRTASLEFISRDTGAGMTDDCLAGLLRDADIGGPSVRVDTISLDEFVYGQHFPAPDMIKLDIEGAESQALTGARRLLKEKRPILVLEIHWHFGREAWQVLRDCRYRISDLGGRAVVSEDDFCSSKSQFIARPE